MSKKDDVEAAESDTEVTTVSPYGHMSLQYGAKSELEITNSQLRLACLEASVTFHENKEAEGPNTIVRTAKQFWAFVNDLDL